MGIAEWFLNRAERDNPHTRIDERHRDGSAWSTGNQVRALFHGHEYFREVLRVVEGTRAGDLILFTDWRGDADERLAGPRTEVARVLAAAARRGVLVKGLIWRSHADRLHFSAAANRRLADELRAAGGDVLLDMRVPPGGSHHQKLFVVRHPGRPERDVAFVGGIDLSHGRNDSHAHKGDPQRPPMAEAYGPRPPWHDIQLEIRGPAVGDVELTFRERWGDPTPLTHNPVRFLRDRLSGLATAGERMPPQLPDPAPSGSPTAPTCPPTRSRS